MLVYYAITNAAALTLRREPGGVRPIPQLLAAAGLAGCLLLAVTLPASSVLAGAGVLAAGAAGYATRRLRSR